MDVVLPAVGVEDYVQIGCGIWAMGLHTMSISFWNITGALWLPKGRTQYCQCTELVLKAVLGQGCLPIPFGQVEGVYIT